MIPVASFALTLLLCLAPSLSSAQLSLDQTRHGQLASRQLTPSNVQLTSSQTNSGVHNFRISPEHSTMTTSGNKPAFCHDLDCPQFTVVNKTKDYEVRRYIRSEWVTTQLTGVDYDSAMRPMFMKLFNYISGNNSRKEKIAMTAPVINRVIPGAGPACVNNFTMSFFMSPAVHSPPPQPSDTHVYLSSLPGQTVFVAQYGGYSSQSVMLQQADLLGQALLRDGRKFHSDQFYTAGYDSPFKLFNRHNEIWFLAH